MTLSTQVDPVLSRERKFFISGFMWRDTARVAFLSIFSSKPGTPTGNQQPHHQRLTTTIYRMPVLGNHTIYCICCYRFDILRISHVVWHPMLYIWVSQYSAYLATSRTMNRTAVRCCYCITTYTIYSTKYIDSLLSLVLLYLVLFILLSLLYIVYLAHFTPPPARRTIYSRRPCTSLLHLVSTIYSTDAQLYTLYIGLLYVVYFSLAPAHDFVAQYIVVVFYSPLLHLVAARFALSRIFSVLPYNCIA